MYICFSALVHDCVKRITSNTGFIVSPDSNGDGQYDFNLDCQWIVGVEQGALIEYHFVYHNIGICTEAVIVRIILILDVL